jgi:transketolase
MRNIFLEKILEGANKNNNIYFLTADLGFNAFEPFREKYPEKFINIGVAENNMVGVAAGMALSGKKVFIYSIIPFLVFRSFEQIRNIICHNNLDVTIIGTGGGFSYGNQGISHNTTEDLSLMQTLPNIKCFSPGSRSETEFSIDYTLQNNGPAYVRLGKLTNDIDSSISKNYTIGDGRIIKPGGNISLLTTGNISSDIIKVSKILDNNGFQSQVISFPTIKPINKKYIYNIAKRSNEIITIEEHGLIGGFGSIIGSILLQNENYKFRFKAIGLKDKAHKEIGDQRFLKELNGLGLNELVTTIVNFVNAK